MYVLIETAICEGETPGGEQRESIRSILSVICQHLGDADIPRGIGVLGYRTRVQHDDFLSFGLTPFSIPRTASGRGMHARYITVHHLSRIRRLPLGACQGVEQGLRGLEVWSLKTLCEP